MDLADHWGKKSKQQLELEARERKAKKPNMDLKEQIAQAIYKRNKITPFGYSRPLKWEELLEDTRGNFRKQAEFILTLFQAHLEEQLEGLKVREDEEWIDWLEGAYWDEASMLDDGISPEGLKSVAQAQLEYVKKQLRREK